MASKTHLRNRRIVGLTATLLSASPAVAAQEVSVLEAALHFFTRPDAVGIIERFDSLRPAPVSPAEREDALATLPPEGDVEDLDDAQRKKLAAARRVLELHGRAAVYELKVIEVPQAAVALHARAVVLVSEPALDLLDPEELQALVAHEVGHEYFWNEYFRARQDNDRSRLQTLELLSDGLAIVTLRRAAVDPQRLMSALEKVLRYNRERLGAARNEDDHPALGQRRRFASRSARTPSQCSRAADRLRVAGGSAVRAGALRRSGERRTAARTTKRARLARPAAGMFEGSCIFLRR